MLIFKRVKQLIVAYGVASLFHMPHFSLKLRGERGKGSSMLSIKDTKLPLLLGNFPIEFNPLIRWPQMQH